LFSKFASQLNIIASTQQTICCAINSVCQFIIEKLNIYYLTQIALKDMGINVIYKINS